MIRFLLQIDERIISPTSGDFRLTQIKPIEIVVDNLKRSNRLARLDSPEVFGKVYEDTHLIVFRYLYALSGGPLTDVEDMTAETFFRAWRSRHKFEGDDEAVIGWLLKIARHLVIDAYRRDKVRNSYQDNQLTSQPTLGNLPEGLVIAKDERQTLLWLLQTLPDEAREMLVLRYILGWRVNQISRYLDIAENTVSATIHRALARLHRDWQNLMEE
jgi:RNA polymerase sigma-70 factor, ECF subfamily